MVEIMLHLASQ